MAASDWWQWSLQTKGNGDGDGLIGEEGRKERREDPQSTTPP